MIVLECVRRTNQLCLEYQGTLQQDPAVAFVAYAMPVLSVFAAYALGLLLGRSVWS